MKNYSNKYIQYINSKSWREKSRWVKSLTRPSWLHNKARGRCCLLPFLPAQETHHMTYNLILGIGWNWFGFEQPAWHLVPLSKFSHRLVSKPILWNQPIRFIVNFYLRINFIIIWSICKPLLSLPIWFTVYYFSKI